MLKPAPLSTALLLAAVSTTLFAALFTAPLSSPAAPVSAAQLGRAEPGQLQVSEPSRYRFHNGRWWYQANDGWRFWMSGRWQRFDRQRFWQQTHSRRTRAENVIYQRVRPQPEQEELEEDDWKGPYWDEGDTGPFIFGPFGGR